METVQGRSFVCLCTTRQLIWTDETHLDSPIFRWEHDLGGGRLVDMSLEVAPKTRDARRGAADFVVLLSSASKDYVEALEVSTGGSLSVITGAWSIPVLGTERLRLKSLTSIPSSSLQSSMVLAGSCCDGSIVIANVSERPQRGSILHQNQDSGVHWDGGVLRLQQEDEERKLYVSAVAATNCTIYTGRWAWLGETYGLVTYLTIVLNARADLPQTALEDLGQKAYELLPNSHIRTL